uniref:hypothetical protein n=1 Tax=Altererythrobacter segetis TaxID=1104773 RepID=UPI00140B9F1C|nr:hypothetical protein [Altererythrobacter segetis]
MLRFGGSLSAYTRWRREGAGFTSAKEEHAIAAQRNWEWKLLDPALAASGPQAGPITPRSLHALRGFLDVTGWRCIYGLNFGSGSLERAVDEADHVVRILGARLLCLQLGNEVDFWAGNPLLRADPYPFEQYWREYKAFVGAIHSRHPRAPFAGPDAALSLEWMVRYAELARDDALFASGHFYAMGPASDPSMNAERLLAPANAKLEQQMGAVAAMTARTGMRFRLTEANSCFGGGKPGVSDAFASALWAADFLLTTASAGYLGVDLHGGGTGYYTPIAAEPSGPAARPIFHAMRFASPFAGARLRRYPLAGAANASAFFGERRGERLLAVVNKSSAPLPLEPAGLSDLGRKRPALLLHAPSLDARSGTVLEPWPEGESKQVTVPPFSAALIRSR